MAKFILGATLILGLLGSVSTASSSETHTISSTYEVHMKYKKKHHHHLNVAHILKMNYGHYLRGIASWYDCCSIMATGLPFNRNSFSCAMRYVKFYTWVTIRNLNNGLSARCRVLDRGPFVPGRIIDLTYAVKVALGINGGTAPVEIIY